jgi:hypothetical protein
MIPFGQSVNRSMYHCNHEAAVTVSVRPVSVGSSEREHYDENVCDFIFERRRLKA